MRPKGLSDDDYLAFLVGKITMCWGNIDQLLCFDIVRFATAENPSAYPHEIKIDDRFKMRVSHWRRICVGRADDRDKVSAIDKAVERIHSTSSIRHIIVHGQVFTFTPNISGPKKPKVYVFEHRETTKRLSKVAEVAKQHPVAARLMAADLHPSYSIEELEEYVRKSTALFNQMRAASEAILPRPKPQIAPRKES